MRRVAYPVALVLLLVSASAVRAASPDVERGRYIVERVGMCADCHSPRDQTGAPIAEMAFGGAPIGFAPMHPMPVWAEYAPRLMGLPAGYDAVSLARFLQTGVRPDGSEARPPMPPYRLDADDAASVAAYLESLAR
ncbi:MAG: c-type cytochrome [Acetobacteraceae bacterium]|nr:c-type cytochrome [Acetobacteraceae bacterium]